MKRATHPDWSGTLVFDEATNGIALKEYGSTGKYRIDQDNILHIFWDKYPAESFKEVNGIYVKMSSEESELSFMRNFKIERLSVRIPRGRADIELRMGTTDVDTFKQVFVANEYNIPDLPLSCRNIFDLGANIGCSAVYFAEKYPAVKILAVEPDEENYRLLVRNVEQFKARITCVRAAVWDRAEQIYSSDRDAVGQPLGAWGVRVSGEAAPGGVAVQAVTMPELLGRLADGAWVDILKIDIEGAEVELFSDASASWLPRIGIVVVETHDRFKPGSRQAVCSRLGSDFAELKPRGENLVFRNLAYDRR
jgi:FkbM family methyltransferase